MSRRQLTRPKPVDVIRRNGSPTACQRLHMADNDGDITFRICSSNSARANRITYFKLRLTDLLEDNIVEGWEWQPNMGL